MGSSSNSTRETMDRYIYFENGPLGIAYTSLSIANWAQAGVVPDLSMSMRTVPWALGTLSTECAVTRYAKKQNALDRN